MASDACCTPAPPATHVSSGVEGTIGGLKAYLNKPHGAKAAILFVSDVFGATPPLLRKLADKSAAEGYYAVVPDFFNGDPYVPKDPKNPFANFGEWLAIHHPNSKVGNAKAVIKELKAEGYESIGISGFCWGAKVAVEIGKEEDLVKAIVLLHPSLTTSEDIKELKVATAVLGAELDQFTPSALVTGEFKGILDAKPFPTLVKIFPRQAHGWSIRYDVKEADQVKAAQEAHADLLEFYKATLV